MSTPKARALRSVHAERTLGRKHRLAACSIPIGRRAARSGGVLVAPPVYSFGLCASLPIAALRVPGYWVALFLRHRGASRLSCKIHSQLNDAWRVTAKAFSDAVSALTGSRIGTMPKDEYAV